MAVIRVMDVVGADLRVGPYSVSVNRGIQVNQNVKRRMLTLIIRPMANIMEAKDEPP